MKLISDIGKNKKLIEGLIKKYGYGVEHNYWNLRYFYGGGTKSMLFLENNKGIMCIGYSGIYEMLPGILAPEEERFELLTRFLDYLLPKKTKKVFVTVPKQYLKKLKETKRYKIAKKHTIFYLPVYDLKDWDMEGKKWKKLRNIRNRLYSEHEVEFVPCKNFSKKQLKEILEAWKKRRKSSSRIWQPQFYDNVIENDFEGMENAMSLAVDNIPCTISAGWKIPNSNNYYSAIGLLNYKLDGLGEVSIINEMELLKKKGYENVNLGQSEKSLLDFKNKFHPSMIEEEILFSVSKDR